MLLITNSAWWSGWSSDFQPRLKLLQVSTDLRLYNRKYKLTLYLTLTLWQHVVVRLFLQLKTSALTGKPGFKLSRRIWDVRCLLKTDGWFDLFLLVWFANTSKWKSSLCDTWRYNGLRQTDQESFLLPLCPRDGFSWDYPVQDPSSGAMGGVFGACRHVQYVLEELIWRPEWRIFCLFEDLLWFQGSKPSLMLPPPSTSLFLPVVVGYRAMTA